MPTGTQDMAVVRVRDTGVGLSHELLSRVFEPFTQAEATLDRTRGGQETQLSVACRRRVFPRHRNACRYALARLIGCRICMK